VLGRLVEAIEQEDGTGPVIEVIDGMAGSGKTTLALHVTKLAAHHYPDAQLYIDLHGHSEQQPTTPTAAVMTLLRQIGVAADQVPVSLGERIDLWRTELASRRAIVVLDNAASSAQIASLLPAGPGCLALVTSRRRLTGLDGVHLESINVLTEPEAVELLARIVGSRVAAEPDAAREVVRRCGLLPLAIRLAGARLAHRAGWRVADLARRLGESVLPELIAEDRTVSSAFALSYGQLEPAVQRTFRLLGLHPGVRYGPPDVAALTDLPLAEADHHLDDLVDLHLVEEPEPGRYRIHDLLREYAVDLASTDSEASRRAAVIRLVDHVVHATAMMSGGLETSTSLKRVDPSGARRPDLLPAPSSDPMDWLERERPNLIAVSRVADSNGERRSVWMLARAGWRLWYERGYYDDLIDAHQRGLAAARAAGDGFAEGMMANYLASGLHRTGRVELAERMLQLAYECLHRHGDRGAETTLLNNLAAVRLEFGDLRLVRDDALKSLAIYRRQQTMDGLPLILTILGLIECRRGLFVQSLTWHRRSLMAWRECGAVRQVSLALGNIGHLRMLMGHPPAERLLRVAIVLNRRHGNRVAEAEAYNSLGILHARRGHIAEAVDLHRRALEAAHELGEQRLAGTSRVALADTLLAAGDRVAAEDLFREAADQASALHCRYDEARAHDGIARCLVGTDPAAAKEHWEKALAVFSSMGVPERSEVERRLTEFAAGPLPTPPSRRPVPEAADG
jgi:DNA-binding transcriptional ArsR family regulator